MERGEIFNSVTHLVGSVLAAAGLAALVWVGLRRGDPLKLGSLIVYGVSLVALYLFSTLYHSLKGRAKAFFRKLDHTSIYVLIAGTYTPFALNPLRGPIGYGLLAIVWSLAAGGVLQEFLSRRRRRALSIFLYVLMGWLALAVASPLSRSIGLPAFLLLFCGGILYTVGIVFFVLDEKMAHSHGIFHLFVLGGSVAHFLVVFFCVA